MDASEESDIELRVIRDVIDAVDSRLQALKGVNPIRCPRSHIYAVALYAVLVSAREQCPNCRLTDAPMLDSILEGAEVADGINLFDRIFEATITN